jgi:hypothetical protein
MGIILDLVKHEAEVVNTRFRIGEQKDVDRVDVQMVIGTQYTSPSAHPKQKGFLIDRLEVVELDEMVEMHDGLREIFLKPSQGIS